MNVLQISATVSGIIVGYFILYFLRRFKKYDIEIFGGLLVMIFGSGGVIAYLAKVQDEPLLAYYPIGIAIGLVLYIALTIILCIFSNIDDDGKGGRHGGWRHILAKSTRSLRNILVCEPAEEQAKGSTFVSEIKRIIPILIIGLILTSCATGPTPEQIAAQAEEQRQAQIAQEEAAKKQAEQEAAAKAALEAQIAKVHADEKAGDDAAQAGDQQKALTNYMTAFNEAPQPDIKNDAQAKIARFTGTLSALPEVPEEAVRHSVRATAKFKEKDYDSAVSEMQEAVQLAPWWADG